MRTYAISCEGADMCMEAPNAVEVGAQVMPRPCILQEPQNKHQQAFHEAHSLSTNYIFTSGKYVEVSTVLLPNVNFCIVLPKMTFVGLLHSFLYFRSMWGGSLGATKILSCYCRQGTPIARWSDRLHSRECGHSSDADGLVCSHSSVTTNITVRVWIEAIRV